MVDTHTSTKSGLWSDTTVWDAAAVPTDGDAIIIANGHTVYFDDDHSAAGKNFTTGINGITLGTSGATATLRFVTPLMNSSGYLPLKGTTVAAAHDGSNVPLQKILAVADGTKLTAAVAQQVCIKMASGVYELNIVDSIAGNDVTMINNLANTYAAADTVFCVTTYLRMKDGTNISGPGTLYVGDAATAGNQISRPAATTTYVPNATILLGATTSQITNTGGQYYYGWVPTSPATHPAYTTIKTYTDTTHFVLDDDMGFQQGDKIIVGHQAVTATGAFTETAKGLYTVSNYVSGTTTVTLTGALGTTRAVGDFVAWYSRPILITKAVVSLTRNAVASGTMQGVRVERISWTSGNGWTVKGLTHEPTWTADATHWTTGSNHRFTDCTSYNHPSGALTASNKAHLFIGCAEFHGQVGLSTNDTGNVFLNCIAQNNQGGIANTPKSSRFIGCKAKSIFAGGLAITPVDCLMVNCTSSYSDTSYGDLSYPRRVTLYNTTLSSSVPVFLADAIPYISMPTWESIQSYDHGGSSGLNKFWARGGTGLTDNTYQYGGTNSMHFTTNADVNVPMVWDTKFWMPANKSLTFTVPMYKAAGDTGITAEVWIVNPFNDPLWFDPLWAVTPTESTACTTAGSTATTYVVKRAAMPDVTGAWQLVSIMIPPHTAARNLVARIIVKGTTTSKNLYANLDAMEKMLLKTKRLYL